MDAPNHKHGLRNLVTHFVLTSRPYSYADNLMRGFLACALVGKGSDPRSLMAAVLLSFPMWLFLNWYSDGRQRDEGRRIPPRVLVWLPFCVALVACLVMNSSALPYLVAYTGAILLYPLKAVKRVIGPLGPGLRAITVVGHFLTVIACVDGTAQMSATMVLVIAALALFHGARNLVGDIRDVRKDRFEFPARFGLGATLMLLRGVFSAVLLLSWFIPWGVVGIGAPVLLQWVVIEVLALRFGSRKSEIVGYLGHRLFVVVFTLSEVLLAYHFGVSGYLCLGMVLLMALLQPTYGYVPGKVYPSLSEALRGRWKLHTE